MRLAVLAALAGCGSPSPKPPPTIDKRIPNQPDLDLLFVIDNSNDTADKQALFAADLTRFVQALDAFSGGRPNLHVGIVSSTVGTGSANFGASCASPNDDGLLQNAARVSGCTPPNGRFIDDFRSASGARTVNYSGTLDQEIACIATLGTTGCGFGAQLEGMKRGLDGSRPENAGFLRDDADLGIIILTDEDDCSVRDPAFFSLTDTGPGDFRCTLFAYDCTPPLTTAPGKYTNCTTRTDSFLQTPQFYSDFLASVKHPSQIAVGMIAGDPSSTIQIGNVNGSDPVLQTSCMNTAINPPSRAAPGNRLADFTSRFGDRGTFHSICANDYSSALTDIGHTLFTMMSNCLEGPIDTADTDASNPGLQPACTVTDQPPGSIIPACEMVDPMTPDPASARPCAWFGANTSCPADPGVEVHIERDAPALIGTVQVSCKPRQ
jgi:hypothetical protein